MQTEKISGEIQKYTVYTHILELRDRERQVDKYILREREREKNIIQKQRAKEKIRNGERKRETLRIKATNLVCFTTSETNSGLLIRQAPIPS